jgi:glucosamine kinase
MKPSNDCPLDIEVTHIIGIDAGGTKTRGVIKNLATGACSRKTLGAASLSQDLSSASRLIYKLSTILMDKVNAQPQTCVLVCGAAGAGCEANRKTLNESLGGDFAGKLITTDARISLYGAGGGSAVLVIAVGTGSVAMRLNKDTSEQMFGGWGFVAGDLGSGANIGRQLISRVLIEYERSQLGRSALVVRVLALIEQQRNIPLSRQCILDWLRDATPKDFAMFAPLVFEFKEEQLALAIITNAAASICELIELAQAPSPLPVKLIGGISAAIFPFLEKNIQQQIDVPKGNAVDGALYLAEQLTEAIRAKHSDPNEDIS